MSPAFKSGLHKHLEEQNPWSYYLDRHYQAWYKWRWESFKGTLCEFFPFFLFPDVRPWSPGRQKCDWDRAQLWTSADILMLLDIFKYWWWFPKDGATGWANVTPLNGLMEINSKNFWAGLFFKSLQTQDLNCLIQLWNTAYEVWPCVPMCLPLKLHSTY